MPGQIQVTKEEQSSIKAVIAGMRYSRNILWNSWFSPVRPAVFESDQYRYFPPDGVMSDGSSIRSYLECLVRDSVCPGDSSDKIPIEPTRLEIAAMLPREWNKKHPVSPSGIFPDANSQIAALAAKLQKKTGLSFTSRLIDGLANLREDNEKRFSILDEIAEKERMKKYPAIRLWKELQGIAGENGFELTVESYAERPPRNEFFAEICFRRGRTGIWTSLKKRPVGTGLNLGTVSDRSMREALTDVAALRSVAYAAKEMECTGAIIATRHNGTYEPGMEELKDPGVTRLFEEMGQFISDNSVLDQCVRQESDFFRVEQEKDLCQGIAGDKGISQNFPGTNVHRSAADSVHQHHNDSRER